MDDKTGSPSRAEVREALGSLLRDEALFDAFCLDHFPDVHRRFAHGMDRVARETLLLQHVSAAEILAKLGGRTGSADPLGLPPNNLPLRNPNFVGREAALIALHRQLGATSRACVVPSAVFGLGGLGKSSLALEYAHRHATDYPGGLWWVRAEGGPAEALLALAEVLRVAGSDLVRRALARIPEQAPVAEVTQAVVVALQNHPAPTLLVLDNVASIEWRPYLPGGGVRVLVTTRDRALVPTAQALPLAVLTDGEARALAERLAGTVRDAGEIAARARVLRAALGNLPMAVEVAARAVAQWHLSWSAYERLLEAQPVEVLDDESVRGSYARGVFAAIDLSIARLGHGTPAQRLLAGAAAFEPDDIPRALAMATADLSAGLEAHRAIATLEALGLLTADASGAWLSLHRLVRRWITHGMDRVGRELRAEPTSRAIDFLMITALEEERDALLAKLPGVAKLDRDGRDTHTYYEAQIATRRRDGAVYRVMVTSLSGMGPIQGAIKAGAVVQRWKPAHVLLVGIAGGLEKEVATGDVMVASQIADYTVGKVRDEGPREERWVVHPADAYLLSAASNFATGWEDLVAHPRLEAGTPKRHVGVIASGGDVVASQRQIAPYSSDWPKLIGVEMEGGGVAAGLHDSIERPRFLMIRGVSDLADGASNAETKRQWRTYGCHVAAAYAVGLLRDGPVPGTTA